MFTLSPSSIQLAFLNLAMKILEYWIAKKIGIIANKFGIFVERAK
jgi:hypothetical protein